MAELKQPSTLGAIKGLGFQILVAMRFIPNLHSEREIVLYLAPYGGQETRNLIQLMKESGRMAFCKNTVERYLKTYKDEKSCQTKELFV